MRLHLWKPDTWHADALPSNAALVKCVQDIPESLQELERHYAPENYEKRLYEDS